MGLVSQPLQSQFAHLQNGSDFEEQSLRSSIRGAPQDAQSLRPSGGSTGLTAQSGELSPGPAFAAPVTALGRVGGPEAGDPDL